VAIEKLSKSTGAALEAPDVVESFAKQGATATPSTPEELRAQIAEEVKRSAAVVKDAGIKLE
jgi:tripartite-type tricarboxylate transporter receptor subunit TctC